MVNIIKSEIYKYSRRPYFYIINLLAFTIALICPFAFKTLIGEFTVNEVKDLIDTFKMIFIFLPAFSIIFTCVLSEEYSEKTLKNIIPNNISKKKFFFTKLFLQVILISLIYILILCGFIISIFINIKDFNSVSSLIYNFSVSYISCIPTCILGLVIIDFLVVSFKKDIIVYLVYYFIFAQLPLYVNALELVLPTGFKPMKKYILLMGIEPLTKPTVSSNDIVVSIFSSLIYIVIIASIAYYIYSKQEVR